MVNFILVIAWFISCILCLEIGFKSGEGSIKLKAYQRGHMVECLGKSGYYWECE